VIIGEDEVANNNVSIKSMRSDIAENNQISVPFDAAVDYLVDQMQALVMTALAADE
jgi:histidyl-tRNA synthetase